MCSHAMMQEIRRRAIIMGVKVKCSRFMDKGAKTHIRHDSQNISAIFSATFFSSNLRRGFICCRFFIRQSHQISLTLMHSAFVTIPIDRIHEEVCFLVFLIARLINLFPDTFPITFFLRDM
jgi:hypothetical protein